ncbi:hypothetical protein FC71_GL001037 [Latilactobacillus sakei subsp. carnosus DSM 15831]|uniref:hypothetical protein n=1 Tax=Latilactobacillus sakei TaxID=1599 RepID=UPI00019CED30|nr:hypothetical protein [Latilactobacillus sakei]KRL69599.1 hypothetical protein FC71_GL001037 [Latilactobacillus sakei subsp. carnosus DSM 15831]GEP21126.1 hypothetical protein LSA03nite_07140 [Latilactobacillus sakei subsp. carnosus]
MSDMNQWDELPEVEVLKRKILINKKDLFEGAYYINPTSEEPFHDTEDVYDVALVSDLIERNIGDFNNVAYAKTLIETTNYPSYQLIRIEGFDDGTYLLIEIWHSDNEDGYGAIVSELVENWKELI